MKSRKALTSFPKPLLLPFPFCPVEVAEDGPLEVDALPGTGVGRGAVVAVGEEVVPPGEKGRQLTGVQGKTSQ